MELVLLEPSESESKQSGQSGDVFPLPSSKAMLTPVAMPDATPPVVFNKSDEATEAEPVATEARAGDPALTLLAGRYVGQIDARIQRAWLRPRAPLATGLFTCRARITQDSTGRVREVELVGCNGDAAWQTSLVQAIDSASPLPAPPDPAVFSSVVTLDFSSQPFSPDADPAGFEPERRTAMK